MTVNASAHRLQVLVGSQDWSRQVVLFEAGWNPRDRAGLFQIQARLELGMTRELPGEINPRSAAGQALWCRGQAVKVWVTNSSGALVPHPCGWLYILRPPLPPSPENPVLELELGCILALRDFEMPDAAPIGAPAQATSRTDAIAAFLARAGITTWAGAVPLYGMNFAVGKQGGSEVQAAGQLAYGGMQALWQTPQGQVMAVPLVMQPAAPSLTVRIGRDEISYEPIAGAETPVEELRYTAVTRQIQTEAPASQTTVMEEYGPAAIVSPTAGNGTIVIRRTTTTTQQDGTGKRQTVMIEAPLGLVAPVAFPGATALGLESLSEEQFFYDSGPEAKLRTVRATERKLFAAALSETFSIRRDELGPNASNLIYAKVTETTYEYENEVPISTQTTIQEPLGTVIPDTDDDPAKLVYTETRSLQYARLSPRDWQRQEVVRQPLVRVKPEVQVEEDNAKLALIVRSSALEQSTSGQTQPPAAERKPATVAEEEVPIVGVAQFGTFAGEQQERTRTLELSLGAVSAEQLTQLAQIEGAVLMGRNLGCRLQVPLLDALLEAPPLMQWRVIEPDGLTIAYQVDTIQFTHDQTRAVVGVQGIWLGSSDGEPLTPTAIRAPYTQVRLSQESDIVIPEPPLIRSAVTTGIELGVEVIALPYAPVQTSESLGMGLRLGVEVVNFEPSPPVAIGPGLRLGVEVSSRNPNILGASGMMLVSDQRFSQRGALYLGPESSSTFLFPIGINSYEASYCCTASYITFGTSATDAPPNISVSYAERPNNEHGDVLMIAALSGRSWQFLYQQILPDRQRVRFEGYTSAAVSAIDLVWEATLFNSGVIWVAFEQLGDNLGYTRLAKGFDPFAVLVEWTPAPNTTWELQPDGSGGYTVTQI